MLAQDEQESQNQPGQHGETTGHGSRYLGARHRRPQRNEGRASVDTPVGPELPPSPPLLPRARF